MGIAVCWKWVSMDGDVRWAGVSAADHAALEIGLQLATALGEKHVTVVMLGPAESEHAAREAIAAGASAVIRIDASTEIASAATAAAIAPVVSEMSWVVCGDYSPDRGSGSVPALVAAELGSAQALGLVGVQLPNPAHPSAVIATRRLDGGRREVLRIASPAVISVEGSVARLRRASLTREIMARTAPIVVVPGPREAVEFPESIRPYRPRARVLAPPSGSDALARVRALTDAGDAVAHGETVTLDPPAAAAKIFESLREWGYL